MNQNTATITFHSSDFVRLNPSICKEIEILEIENGYSLKIPLITGSSGARTMQEILKTCNIELIRPVVPLVNGKPQDMRYVPEAGDEIIMVFQISGG